jgi:DNA-binding response OmpR family regulator
MAILIVEDEPKIAAFISKALEHEGFVVETVGDGNKAIEKINVNDYALLVLDIMLPGSDGFKVCEKFRELGLNTPVLMLTARDQTQDKVKGLDVGADDYLIKPFELSELLARVRALLRREKNIKPEILSVGDLVMDAQAHDVTRAGRPIKLSRKEYRLLEYLMRRASQLCSRTMIREHIWGFKAVSQNSLDAQIKRLRKKIDNKSSKKLLTTIYGAGYKIRA